MAVVAEFQGDVKNCLCSSQGHGQGLHLRGQSQGLASRTTSLENMMTNDLPLVAAKISSAQKYKIL